MDFVHDITPSEWNKIVTPSSFVLAVIGSRNFIINGSTLDTLKYVHTNITYLINKLVQFNSVASLTDVIIISGKAKGIDQMGMTYAKENGLRYVNILPDWDRFGKSAGFKRNYNIIKYSHRVLAFRYNNSNGTTNGIEYANKLNIPYNVIDKP
jgi:hypothetical protein